MKWTYKDFIYRPTVIKHLGIVVSGFLLGILLYSYLHFSASQNIGELLLSGLLGIVITYVVVLSNAILNRLIPWTRQPGLRLLSGILTHTALGLFLVVTFIGLYSWFLKVPSLFLPESQDVLLKIALLLFCIIIIYNIIYFATYSYYQYAKGQLLEIQLQRRQTQLQLTALKSQLSPHFLFNSMNTLSSLFQTDVIKAEKFIRSLASSYQYTLKTYEEPLVSIAEELSFVTSYCNLIKTRFGDYLTVVVDLPKELLLTKVPPLTLQMLVENAVKHNVMDSAHPLMLTLSTENNQLIVTNNKTNIRNKTTSFNIGLSNITARYELLTRKKVTIENADSFIVRLPLIK